MPGTKGEGTRQRQKNAQCVCKDCGVSFLAFRSDKLRCPECYRKARNASTYNFKHREFLHTWEQKQKQPCPVCGQPMGRRAQYCLKCSWRARIGKRTREDNGWWRGGVNIKGGYRYVRVKVGAGNGAYRPEHHLVWERVNGKPLPKGWVVHHLNGDKLDNRPENVAGMPRLQHHKHPREALRPYERRIKQLESELLAIQQLRMEQ